MNGITGIKIKTVPVNINRLFSGADQVHLNTAGNAVVTCKMFKGIEIEVCIQFAVGTLQQVQIESCGHTTGIIVGLMQRFMVFFPVNANQQATTLPGNLCQAGEKFHRILRIKIADT